VPVHQVSVSSGRIKRTLWEIPRSAQAAELVFPPMEHGFEAGMSSGRRPSVCWGGVSGDEVLDSAKT